MLVVCLDLDFGLFLLLSSFLLDACKVVVGHYVVHVPHVGRVVNLLLVQLGQTVLRLLKLLQPSFIVCLLLVVVAAEPLLDVERDLLEQVPEVVMAFVIEVELGPPIL